VVYSEALSSGKSVFNIENTGEAAVEIKKITEELKFILF
jgi:translation initiation factor 1 (eIF-1/SUI1)